MDMTPSQCDPCVYINKDNGKITLISIYVDDLVVASNDPNKLRSLKTELAKAFEMT